MKKFAELKFSELKTKKINDFETSFSLQPLERGFGNTLGNAIRRILLSSVSGVAPFALKVEGVDHEFQTISNVTEDAVQLVLNLKNVKFVYNKELFEDGKVMKVTLTSKKGEVTASDFTLPAGVSVVNTDEYIATNSKAGALNLELFLIAGRGFSSFEENKKVIKDVSSKIESSLKSGTLIAIDSDFSPIVSVSYEAVELNSSSAIIEEKLTLNVKTNGIVEAHEAVAQATNILVQHAQAFLKLSEEQEDIFEKKVQEEEVVQSKSIHISMLDLSVRSYNCLKRAGYETLDDLSGLSIAELSAIQNLGKKSVEEIIEKLTQHNIVLKGDE